MIIVRFIILTKICVINRNNISYFGFLSINLNSKLAEYGANV